VQTGSPASSSLSDAAKNGFFRQVGNCWSVGSASTDVLQTRVTVAFSMTEDARPDAASIRMIGFEGGTEANAQVAFRMAKSAIVRCTGDGYDLPADKYEQWREVELTFDAERMRMR